MSLLSLENCPAAAGKKTDDFYLELISAAVFQSVISPRAAVKRWPEIKAAFFDFNVDKVAEMGEKEVQKLMTDERIIKNRKKILATVENARVLRTVKQKYGSFRHYLASFSNQEAAVQDLAGKIKYIGRPSLRWVLECAQTSVVFTFGHSTQNLENFISILKEHGVTMVADIRSVPRSRHNPQFNRETFPGELAKAGLKYRHFAGLGGLRKAKKDSVNTAWDNDAFRGYADYMQTDDFWRAIESLIPIIKKETVVLVCAEGLWWRCHRRLVSDALLSKSIRVFHILPGGKLAVHQSTSFARQKAGKIFYPKR